MKTGQEECALFQQDFHHFLVPVNDGGSLFLSRPERTVLADSQLCFVGVNTNSSFPVTGGNTEASPRLFQPGLLRD
ncbi:hypothetical protein NQZ68_022800 [Dissostichus eleginoides]|nr:hypothetical protein NQZ68_022800 [Dissostichus eleginoides]